MHGHCSCTLHVACFAVTTVEFVEAGEWQSWLPQWYHSISAAAVVV
jgi:hypothetical protein